MYAHVTSQQWTCTHMWEYCTRSGKSLPNTCQFRTESCHMTPTATKQYHLRCVWPASAEKSRSWGKTVWIGICTFHKPGPPFLSKKGRKKLNAQSNPSHFVRVPDFSSSSADEKKMMRSAEVLVSTEHAKNLRVLWCTLRFLMCHVLMLKSESLQFSAF